MNVQDCLKASPGQPGMESGPLTVTLVHLPLNGFNHGLVLKLPCVLISMRLFFLSFVLSFLFMNLFIYLFIFVWGEGVKPMWKEHII